MRGCNPEQEKDSLLLKSIYGKHRFGQVNSNAEFDSSSDRQSPPAWNDHFHGVYWPGVIYVVTNAPHQFWRKFIRRRYVAGRRRDGVSFCDEIYFEIYSPMSINEMRKLRQQAGGSEWITWDCFF
jgi:hypothetical protein